MDKGRAAEEMYVVFGGVEGSVCDAVWTRVLLDVYRGLGEGEAGVPAL